MKIREILSENTIDEMYRKVIKGLNKSERNEKQPRENWDDIMGTKRSRYKRGHGGAWKQR